MTDKNNTYAFNFEAIPTCSDSCGHGGRSVWTVKAKNVEEAVDLANEYFKDNGQFKFNYSLILKEHGVLQIVTGEIEYDR